MSEPDIGGSSNYPYVSSTGQGERVPSQRPPPCRPPEKKKEKKKEKRRTKTGACKKKKKKRTKKAGGKDKQKRGETEGEREKESTPWHQRRRLPPRQKILWSLPLQPEGARRRVRVSEFGRRLETKSHMKEEGKKAKRHCLATENAKSHTIAEDLEAEGFELSVQGFGSPCFGFGLRAHGLRAQGSRYTASVHGLRGHLFLLVVSRDHLLHVLLLVHAL
eukprot:822667-Rhodomonas_salina.2